MNEYCVAGPLIRMLRMRHNWSQETLAGGICSVSYLSKIEQGKVEVSRPLLDDLLHRLGAEWNESAEMIPLRDELYEAVFSFDNSDIREKFKLLEENWESFYTGPCYLDFAVLRAYCCWDPELVPEELSELLDTRQRALMAILRHRNEEAYRIYPCPLTAFCVAETAYMKGIYTLALEYFQIAYDQAAREGYVHLMMYAQHYMANCCSDLGSLEAMYRHSRIAGRIGRALGDEDVLEAIRYNIAATKTELGDFQEAYDYFSGLEAPEAMALHKLAVCCEALGKKDEALAALDRAEGMDSPIGLKGQICGIVRYRLEHPDYLHDRVYGELLMDVFERIRKELHTGYARFHLRWVMEWLCANRQYRRAYEILRDFPENLSLAGV